MKTKRLPILLSLFISLLLLAAFTGSAAAKIEAAAEPVVHAVLFFSPTCGHCKYVREEVLPPLFETYGSQLDILEIDMTTEDGNALFNQTMDTLSVPDNYRGVPFLIVEDQYLVGSVEIPEQFPGLIAAKLEAGGTAWPDLPGLEPFIASYQAETAGNSSSTSETTQPTPEATSLPTAQPGTSTNSTQSQNPANKPMFILRFEQDLVGNSVAVAVLIAMIVVVIFIAIAFINAAELKLWPQWIIPVLVVIGMGIAFYMSFIEVTGGEAICGPVGDCNAVQNSPYAVLFGVIHVGVLGLVGYLSIGIAWAVGRWGKMEWRSMANMGMFLLNLFGVIFTIYLTYLEPFVIGATCIWCISSAITITLLLLNTTPVALQSWLLVEGDDEEDEDRE